MIKASLDGGAFFFGFFTIFTPLLAKAVYKLAILE